MIIKPKTMAALEDLIPNLSNAHYTNKQIRISQFYNLVQKYKYINEIFYFGNYPKDYFIIIINKGHYDLIRWQIQLVLTNSTINKVQFAKINNAFNKMVALADALEEEFLYLE